MVVFPGCKINIGLNIVDKRETGYHNLESIFYPIGLTDVLEIVRSETFSIQLSGIKVDGPTENNLVVKAYRLLKEKHNLPPVSIHLHKNVPLGAGLGGGSANGSAALVALNDLFDLNLSDEALIELAAELGSDCPFFILNQPCFVGGRGELLTPFDLSLKAYFIHVVNPGIHINTKTAFQGIDLSGNNNKIKNCFNSDPKKWKDIIINDFEATIFPNFPEITSIKEKLYENGAAYASMTGTGSTVYGIFDAKPTLSFPNYYEWIDNLD